jgi:hypothetical protein
MVYTRKNNVCVDPYIMKKALWAIAQPKFISPLPMGFALHTLEEGDFFWKNVKKAAELQNSGSLFCFISLMELLLHCMFQ